MPKRTDIKSILIIGAGPIIIGQACEFDYSGTQALFGSMAADGNLITRTRRPFLDYVSHGKKKFLGCHCAYPGLGMAEVKDRAFAYVPAA